MGAPGFASARGSLGPSRPEVPRASVGEYGSVDVLGPSGVLAERLPGYESRDGQVRVALAVESVLEKGGVLRSGAGPGLGQPGGSLLPAILSGKKVVISTATKALQDQIAERDLPRLLEVLGMNVEYAVMKGLSNYVCRRRFKEYELSEDANRPQVRVELDVARRFVRESESGDLSELRGIPEHSRTRLEIASSSETRLGAPCPEFERCFVTEMRKRGDAAQIVIVNHHLFFADLALRGPHPGRVLPDYEAVVFDEAHQLEDTAALFFGMRIAEAQLLRLERDAVRVLSRANPLGALAPGSGHSLLLEFAAATTAFFQVLRGAANAQRGALEANFFQETGRDGLARLRSLTLDVKASLASRAALADQNQELKDLLDHTARRFETLAEELEEFTEVGRGFVLWVEVLSTGTVLNATPVDLAHVFRSRLFDKVRSVSLLSATLSTGKSGGFSFVRSRLGLAPGEGLIEVSEPSPFDYERQVVLYLPKDLPQVRSDDFHEKAADRVWELIEASDGGAFVLTTSLASMRRFHEEFGRRGGGRPLLLQGAQPKEHLLATFRSSGRAVLVATASFWEGVDVPGRALRLVVLEKLPFAVPTDPVQQARSQALERAGKSAFSTLAIPGAQITLKQGFGRLIRRGDDRGIVALLDERATSQGYGRRVLSALPAARRESELGPVLRFARELARS